MHNILLLDKGNSSIHNFKKTLASRGFALIHEKTPANSFLYLKDKSVDLIVISSSLAPEISVFKRFIGTAGNIPIIFLYDNSKEEVPDFSSKSSNIYSFKEPLTFRKFLNWTQIHLKQKDLENRKNQLKKELASAQAVLRFFNDVTRTYIKTSELNKVLISIMDKAKNATSATAWSVLLNHPASKSIPLRATKFIRKARIKKSIGIAGAVLGKGEPVNIEDALMDKRFDRKLDGFAGFKIKTILYSPIKIKNETIGVIRLMNKSNSEPFNDNDLHILRSASSYIEMSIDRALLFKKIEKLSVTDELTGLYNFRYLNQAISIELERGKRYGSLFSLIFMDLDDFKKVNDRFGHQVGSKILVAVAKLLKKNLRSIDVISRYGGDEFVMILPQTSREIGFTIAERLRKAMKRQVFLKKEGLKIELTASFGVASYPDNASTKEKLLKIADKAMYHGKFSTKNTVFAAK